MKRSPTDIYTAPAAPPTARVTVVSSKFEPPSIGATMTVERVHAALMSAESGSTLQLMLLYRDIVLSDAHVQAEFAKRKLAVLGEQPNVRPFDKTNPDDVAAADLIRAQIGDLTGWITACSHLMDSALWPVSVMEKVFAPAGNGYRIAELVPVPHRLQDHREGSLRIFDVDPQTGVQQFTSQEADPRRYILHRGHLLSTPDKFGGPMRALVFWWLLVGMDRSWWARFLERYGSPFLLGRYNQGDDTSRVTLENAFSFATRIGGLVVSKETEIEIKDAASSSSGEGYEKFLLIGQREISKLILGQTLSAEARSTGMGSGVASLQAEVRDDIRQFDGLTLGMTLRDQLFRQLLRATGHRGRPPFITWGTLSPAALKGLADLLGSLNEAGLEIADEAVETVGAMVGFPLRRTGARGASVAALRAFSAAAAAQDPAASIARGSAAELAQAFRGAFAPIRRIILESRSAAECEAQIRAYYADFDAGRIAPIIESALQAYAANGASAAAR